MSDEEYFSQFLLSPEKERDLYFELDDYKRQLKKYKGLWQTDNKYNHIEVYYKSFQMTRTQIIERMQKNADIMDFYEKEIAITETKLGNNDAAKIRLRESMTALKHINIATVQLEQTCLF